jgi:hypothetical protein
MYNDSQCSLMPSRQTWQRGNQSEGKPRGKNAARQVFHGAQIRPAILPQ